MINGTTTQALIFKARMQAKEELKEKRELLEVWDDNTNNTMGEVLYYEALIELNDTPQVEHALRNAYRKHERACKTYNKVHEEVSNLEKAIDALETAEYYTNEW